MEPNSPPTQELPLYQCHKQVRAARITGILCGRSDGKGPGATLQLDGGAEVSVRDGWMAKHEPEPGGFFVIYADGYQSFSPAEAFEDGYTRRL